MANLIASNALNTSVTWDYNNDGNTANDWRIITATGPFDVERYNSGSAAWDRVFRFYDGTVRNTSYLTINVQTDEPKVVLSDTAGAGAVDYQIRNQNGSFSVDIVGVGVRLHDDGANWFVHGALAAGSTATADAIRWNVFQGNLAAAASTTVTSPYTNKIIGALVMISKDANAQANQTYVLYDYRFSASAGNDYYADVHRNVAAADDVQIFYHPNFQGGFYKVIIFSEP